MNSKLCKIFRGQAGGYKNQTSTPGTMPFPGVMPRGYRFPVVSRISVNGRPRGCNDRNKRVTVERIVNSGLFSRTGNFYSADPVWKLAWYPKLGPDGKTVDVVIEGQGEGEWGQAFEVMPVSKPGRLNKDQPKGMYRALKRLERKVGLVNIVKGGTVG